MEESREPIASERTLTRQELDELERLQAELARLSVQSDALVFVLGSYNPLKKERLLDVRSEVERQISGTVRARLMDQFIPDSDGRLHGHYKFRTIARQSDALVGVVEDDQGGFTYEQGIIVDNPGYFRKTFVLKRSYAPIIERRKYSWMQSTSLFSELDRADRLYEWHGQAFGETRDKLLTDLERFLR